MKKDRSLGKGKEVRKKKGKLKIESRMRKECARKIGRGRELRT